MRLSGRLFALALLATAACGGRTDGIYLVSGTITTVDSQGQRVPLQGVTVALKEVTRQNQFVGSIAIINNSVTDAAGHYGVRGASGNYTVDASLDGYTFTPAQTLVTVNGQDVSGQDFEAVPSATSTP